MYHSSAKIYDTLMIISCFVEELKLFQDKSCQMCFFIIYFLLFSHNVQRVFDT